MKKRFLSLLLAVAMVATMIVLPANAAEEAKKAQEAKAKAKAAKKSGK